MANFPLGIVAGIVVPDVTAKVAKKTGLDSEDAGLMQLSSAALTVGTFAVPLLLDPASNEDKRAECGLAMAGAGLACCYKNAHYGAEHGINPHHRLNETELKAVKEKAYDLAAVGAVVGGAIGFSATQMVIGVAAPPALAVAATVFVVTTFMNAGAYWVARCSTEWSTRT